MLPAYPTTRSYCPTSPAERHRTIARCCGKADSTCWRASHPNSATPDSPSRCRGTAPSRPSSTFGLRVGDADVAAEPERFERREAIRRAQLLERDRDVVEPPAVGVERSQRRLAQQV